MDELTLLPYCEEMIEFAAQFGKRFSYEPEDISALEEILDIISNEYQKNIVSDELAETVAISAGIYLGEVMLRNGLAQFGYHWETQDSEPVLAKDEKNKMFPVTKVYKRIKNGEGENVSFFYHTGFMLAKGGFDKK